ncbi:MAG: hypothetical protein ACRD29_26010, partial [Acidimicrobiales bacterium]
MRLLATSQCRVASAGSLLAVCRQFVSVALATDLCRTFGSRQRCGRIHETVEKYGFEGCGMPSNTRMLARMFEALGKVIDGLAIP